MESNPATEIVRLGLLERASAACLSAFFKPYAAFLRERGVDPDRLSGLEDVARLHGVLTAPGAKLPDGLAEALLDVADIAAGEAVRGPGRDCGGQMALFGARRSQMTPEDVAFTLYAERGASALAPAPALAPGEARRFVEYLPSTPCVPSGFGDAGKAATLTCRLSDWYGRRNRGPYIEVRTVDAGSVAVWRIIHGRPRQRLSVIKDDEKRDMLSIVPDKEDTVQFDRRTCVLSVNAQYPAEADAYRQEIGEIYFHGRDSFVAGTTLDASPVLEDLDHVLSPAGVPGLLDVRLRELRVRLPGTGSELRLKGVDLRPDIRSILAGRPPCGVSVMGLTLAIRVEGRRQPKLVTVEPPNRLTFDRRTHEALVREYLISRGLLRLPPSTPTRHGLEARG